MSGAAQEAQAETPDEIAAALADWRQGDYTLGLQEIVVIDGLDADGAPDFVTDRVAGVALVSQTCDVVNMAPHKEHVVVCPLVRLIPEHAREVARGSTPQFVRLEHPPEPDVFVDLGRMTTVHKTLLARLERNPGFSSDEARVRFAGALERKHGRFAFPTPFNDQVLARLRDRVAAAEGKDSANGKAYTAISRARVSGHPSWEATSVTVTFFFIVGEGVDLAATAKVLDEHFGKLDWPEGFVKADPPYELLGLHQMTAEQWVHSQEIDWTYISTAKAAKKAA